MNKNFDHKEVPVEFFMICFATVVFGLLIGGTVDAFVRKYQKDGEWKDRKFSKALSFFLLQISINILLLLFLDKTFKYFVSWLQLSVSGALFSVLLFAGQRNLFDNALRITNF